jgi:hypothetical protein
VCAVGGKGWRCFIQWTWKSPRTVRWYTHALGSRRSILHTLSLESHQLCCKLQKPPESQFIYSQTLANMNQPIPQELRQCTVSAPCHDTILTTQIARHRLPSISMRLRRVSCVSNTANIELCERRRTIQTAQPIGESQHDHRHGTDGIPKTRDARLGARHSSPGSMHYVQMMQRRSHQRKRSLSLCNGPLPNGPIVTIITIPSHDSSQHPSR